MDNHAFLDAVVTAPEDDAPRLIYADWLEEHGLGERAEFIRVQCELAQKAKYDPSRLPLEKRELELLVEYGAVWAKPVIAIARDYEFHRGFVDTVAIGARKLLTHGAKLFRLAPIRHIKMLRLGSSNVTTTDLANCNLLPQIRGLMLQGKLNADEMRTLVTAPGLKGLSALTLECSFPPKALDPLLAGCLPHLETLDLSVEESILTIADVETLAKADWAAALKHFNLKNQHIYVGGVHAIAASKRLKGLRRLKLHNCRVGLGGVRALTESSSLPNLMTLDLRRNRLTDSAVRALASPSKLPALTELYLGMNEIGPEGARTLANWPGLARLRLLHLYSNPIGDDGVCALAGSPYVANLWRLDVTCTDIGDRGTLALLESPYLKNVRVGSFKGEKMDASAEPTVRAFV